jgi:hypothetical protein
MSDGDLERLCWANTELALALMAERERARRWKRLAKRIWTREVPDKVGRHGCAARDVRIRGRGGR